MLRLVAMAVTVLHVVPALQTVQAAASILLKVEHREKCALH